MLRHQVTVHLHCHLDSLLPMAAMQWQSGNPIGRNPSRASSGGQWYLYTAVPCNGSLRSSANTKAYAA